MNIQAFPVQKKKLHPHINKMYSLHVNEHIPPKS